MLHIALHFLVPFVIALTCFRNEWKRAWFIMIATMIVDLDHLLANPIYDPGRCSIGFHPLHQLWLVGFYFILCFFPQSRLVGIGLMIHMGLDAVDCQVTNGIWFYQSS